VKATADYDGTRIVVVVQRGYAEAALATRRIKAVGGGRFSKTPTPLWRFPASVGVCLRLREQFGSDLKITNELAAWYVAEQQQAAAQAARVAQNDAVLTRLPHIAPTLYATLRPDQRAGVAAVATAYKDSLLVADQPGTGKTRVTIGGILEAGLTGPILVVAPKLAVKRVWWREWVAWGKDSGVAVFLCRGTRARRQGAVDRFLASAAETKVLIIVAEMLRVQRAPLDEDDPKAKRHRRGRVAGYSYPELFRTPWTAVIVDESHKLLGSLTVAKSNLMGEGLAQLHTVRRYAVTGTPYGRGGRVMGMFGTLAWLWPQEYTSFWRWAEQHFNIEETSHYVPGGRGKQATHRQVGTLRGGQGEEEFLKSLGPRILRRTKEEVLPWLPLKQWIVVESEMMPGQTKQYKELSDTAELSTAGGPILANGVLSELTRAKQVANGELVLRNGKARFTGESGKIEDLIEILAERGIAGGTDAGGTIKVVVASQFVEFLQAVRLRLDKEGIGYWYLDGKTPDSEREFMMDSFQDPANMQRRVFLLQSKTGGISITLDAADELHMLDELDDPGDNEQVEDRVHRGTRNADGTWNTHAVRIFNYRSVGTIDETRAEVIADKGYDQFRTMDGRRGLAYARSIIKYRGE
jgi:SNF2 family DNA or RNA helicase